MSWKTYFLLTGIIFALVALAHALRIYMDWPVMIAHVAGNAWRGFLFVSGRRLLKRKRVAVNTCPCNDAVR